MSEQSEALAALAAHLDVIVDCRDGLEAFRGDFDAKQALLPPWHGASAVTGEIVKVLNNYVRRLDEQARLIAPSVADVTPRPLFEPPTPRAPLFNFVPVDPAPELPDLRIVQLESLVDELREELTQERVREREPIYIEVEAPAPPPVSAGAMILENETERRRNQIHAAISDQRIMRLDASEDKSRWDWLLQQASDWNNLNAQKLPIPDVLERGYAEFLNARSKREAIYAVAEGLDRSARTATHDMLAAMAQRIGEGWP